MADPVEAFAAAPLRKEDTPALRALWHLAHGDWTAAHEAAQVSDERDAAWVHALLHRQEGDDSNAAYWYRRAGRPGVRGPIDEERRAITAELLLKRDG